MLHERRTYTFEYRKINGCDKCPFDYEDIYCKLNRRIYTFDYIDEKPDDCPLKEIDND